MVINLCYVHTSYLYKYFIFYLAEVIIHCFTFIQGQSRNLASLLLFYSISLPNSMQTIFMDTGSKKKDLGG